MAVNTSNAIDVVNRITVGARWQPKPDEAIQEDAARRWLWSPLQNADQITVLADAAPPNDEVAIAGQPLADDRPSS